MTTPFPAGTPRPDPTGSEVETIHLSRPRDLLSAIPYLLGFHPDPGTVVVVALRHGTVAVSVCVNLSAAPDGPGVWARVDRPLTEAGTSTVAVIGYLPHDGGVDLLTFAAASPWPLLDVLRVDGDRWWSLTCPNGPTCCPAGERLVPDPAVTAPLIAGAAAPAANRAELAACLQPGPPAVVDRVAALLPLDPAPTSDALFRAVIDSHAERVDGPVPLTSGRAALLLHALSVIEVRDACCSWHCDASWWCWTALAPMAPPGWIAPVAALISVTAYQRGNTVLSRMAAEHALTDNPDYGLAHLMAGINAALVHPRLVRETLTHAASQIALLRQYEDLSLVSRNGVEPCQPHPDHGPAPATADNPEGGADE